MQSSTAAFRPKRLLRKPGGFEGFRCGVTDRPPDALRVPPPADVEGIVLERKLAPPAVANGTYRSQEDVAQVSDLDYFDLVVGEGHKPVFPPLTDTVVAVQASFDRGDPRNGLDVLIDDGQKRPRSRLFMASIAR